MRLSYSCIAHHKSLFRILSDDLAKLSPQDLSSTAWSFSVLGLKHARFFEAVSRQVIQR